MHKFDLTLRSIVSQNLPVSEKFPHETSIPERLRKGFALVAIFAVGRKNDRLVSAAGETARNNEPTADTGPGVCFRFANCVLFRVQCGAQV
jgi:hypothetical protein